MAEIMTGMVRMHAPSHISSVSTKGVEFRIDNGMVDVPSDCVGEMRHHGLKTEDEFAREAAEEADKPKRGRPAKAAEE